MSDFAALSVALSSLYAQRRGLDTAGHNVANANTEGYSRQRVGFEALGGPVVPAIHAVWKGAGAGVGVQSIERLRDEFLEARALREHGARSSLGQTQQIMARVEMVFGEPGDNGVSAQLADFWAAWDDVANNPGDLAARSQLLERTATLTTGFNRAASDLASIWTSSVEQLGITVADVNATAARVAELNGAIDKAVKSGLTPNDLADQRDLLVMQLSESIGATVRQGEYGVVDVYVGGTALVRGDRSESLVLNVPGGTDVTNANTAPVQVRWAKDGYPAAVEAGSAGGLLDAVNRVLPNYLDGLDAVAADLAGRVNAAHAGGVDLSGNPGGPVFNGTTAATLARAISDPAALAAAAPGAGALDGSNALALAELAGITGGPDQRFRTFIIGLGVETQAVNRRVDIQHEITSAIDSARLSASGVNLDEEMANMVAFQHAYEAAARFMTTVDEMLDTLIGRTGLVGR